MLRRSVPIAASALPIASPTSAATPPSASSRRSSRACAVARSSASLASGMKRSVKRCVSKVRSPSSRSTSTTVRSSVSARPAAGPGAQASGRSVSSNTPTPVRAPSNRVRRRRPVSIRRMEEAIAAASERSSSVICAAPQSCEPKRPSPRMRKSAMRRPSSAVTISETIAAAPMSVTTTSRAIAPISARSSDQWPSRRARIAPIS